MKDYLRFFLASVVCFGLSLAVLPAQQLTYDVFKSNKRVGTMTVTRTQKDGQITYTSDSRMTLSFLIKVDLKFQYEAIFRSGQLQESLVKNFQNGNLKKSSVGKRAGYKYRTILNEKETTWVEPAHIDYCILTSYFKEPSGRKEMFSERWGKFIAVEKIEPEKYKLEIPDGSTNYLSYREGICTEVEVNHMLATIYFKLRS